MNKYIQEVIDNYLIYFPNEKSRLSHLQIQIKNKENLVDRKNFTGHLTASGFILSKDKKKGLLIYHKKLNKFLQPGGHLDIKDSNPLDACLREIEEETGLNDIDLLDFSTRGYPLDIDTHFIPNNVLKKEPEHYHHDFRYIFVANEDSIKLQEEEVSDFRWVDLDEIMQIDTLKALILKIKARSIEQKPVIFLQNIVEKSKTIKPISVFVVTHILPDRPFFLNALANIATIEGIIPKPNSINQETLNLIKDRYRILPINKHDLRGIAKIEKYIKESKYNIIFLDIGGYFAPIINEIKLTFKNKILGVIEDTENGLQKYQSIEKLSVPLISVARSPLKNNEDYLVGQSVVFSADFILRGYNQILNYMKIGIIGFGKIGNSISFHLSQNNINCLVFDTDPTKRIEAISKGYISSEKDILLNESDVIFCGTGNKSLDINDFKKLKNGCFIVSVTSSDDEMQLNNLKREYRQVEVAKYITKFYNDTKYFYLLNKGNAVNFINNAVVGNFIFLVQSEMLLSMKYLSESNLDNKIHELPGKYRIQLAQEWLSVFNV